MWGEESGTAHHGFPGKDFKKELANLGILGKIDAVHAIGHNKIVIVDREITVSGQMTRDATNTWRNLKSLTSVQLL